MSILIIGDTHFRHDNVEETGLMGKRLKDIISSKTLTHIAVMGDILDRHEKINLFQLSRALEFLSLLRRESDIHSPGCKLIILIGNHDRPNNSSYESEDHVFSSLSLWKDTYVVDRETEILGDVNILAFPFLPLDTFFSSLETDILSMSEYDLILCHQEFRGAKMGPSPSESDDVWDESYPLCVSGHIHDYQKIGSNLIYVGTPFQHSYHDASPKTVSLFTKVDGNMVEERVSLGLRVKKLLTLTPKQLDTFIPQGGVRYRIKIKGTLQEVREAMRGQLVLDLTERYGIEFKEQLERLNRCEVKQPTVIESKVAFRDKVLSKLKGDELLTNLFKELI
jgi:DNA repair exonuclease SbcCD nuclease subunit